MSIMLRQRTYFNSFASSERDFEGGLRIDELNFSLNIAAI